MSMMQSLQNNHLEIANVLINYLSQAAYLLLAVRCNPVIPTCQQIPFLLLELFHITQTIINICVLTK